MDGWMHETQNEEHSDGGGSSRRVGLCPGLACSAWGALLFTIWGRRQAHLLGQGVNLPSQLEYKTHRGAPRERYYNKANNIMALAQEPICHNNTGLSN